MILIKYSILRDLTYWQNFIICVVIEILYQAAFLTFFGVIILQTGNIAGWGVNELIVLLGIDTITSELLTGLIIVNNSRELPAKIWSGELDHVLLRPIHPLFNLMLGRPYFPSIIGALTGFIIIAIGLIRLNYFPGIMSIIGAATVFSSGFLIVFSIVTIFSLLTFFFNDTSTLPRIGERLVYSFSSRPHSIFSGFLKTIFFFILPIVYVSSITSETLRTGIEFQYLISAVILAIIFLFITQLFWKVAIKRYTSAGG
ncbi:MAG: ABC-2 family transporter protein [bacterium]